MSLSRAINELIQRGSRLRPPIKYVDGFPMLDLPKPKKLLTTEWVKEMENENW